MSIQQPPRPPAGPPRSPGASPNAGGGASAFDPLKLLQKYKYLLAGSVFAGAVVGVATHYFLLFFFPGFRSTVLFECSPVQTEIQVISSDTIDEDEMARFMGTQVETIRGELVMNAVLSDARLEAEAPHWTSQFLKNGNLDIVEAYEELEKIINARSLPNTYLIELSVQVGDREDAAGLVGLVKDNYIRILNSGTSTGVTRRKQQIQNAIKEANATLDSLTARKNRLMREQGVGSADVSDSAEGEMLRLVNAEIVNRQQQIEAYQVMLESDEAQLKKETPIVYDSTLRERVEQMPQVLTLKQRISDLQSSLSSLESGGFGREHRTYKITLQQLEATQRELTDVREALLLEAFESRVEAARMAMRQFRAQIADLTTEQETLQAKLNELTQTSEEIEEINRQIESAIALMAQHEMNLADLTMTSGLDTASRITVAKSENVPDRPSFPVIYIIVPAVMFLITGLTAVTIVVFEMLDQRVKSAADIALIPRTPILGIIPDAEEDPARHESLATLFMDSPNSVLAEHFRQLRTKIVKNMQSHDHKTLLIVGAMPGSGATSVTTNLAQACIAAGKSVLIVDTNFRRARVHNAYGLQDSPGLAEVLAGKNSIDEGIQHIQSGPDILPAGSRNLRVVERLGTDKMGEVLAEVSSRYDIVLLDVAPAIVSGDAMTLTAQVDATMLVARAMQEKRGQIARLKNELSDSRAEFLGVLVNGVKSSAGGYMRKNIRTSHQYHATEAAQAT
ncbi:MAG: AAA family ATPase [Phycisphaerales bacterium]